MNNNYSGRKRSRSSSGFSNEYPAKRRRFNNTTSTSVRNAKKAQGSRGFRPFTSSTKEKKVYDTGDYIGTAGEISVVNCSSSGFVSPIFIPELGSDYNQRIGRKVNIRSIYLKWRCFPRLIQNPSGAPYIVNSQWPETAARILLVKDTNPNGVLPSITDILQVDATSGLVDPLSFINMNNRDRFTIIMDKMHQFGAISVGVQASIPPNIVQTPLGSMTWTGKKYKKCNHEVVFNGSSTGAIADIASGAFYIVYLGSETLGSNRYSSCEMNWRIRYDDN